MLHTEYSCSGPSPNRRYISHSWLRAHASDRFIHGPPRLAIDDKMDSNGARLMELRVALVSNLHSRSAQTEAIVWDRRSRLERIPAGFVFGPRPGRLSLSSTLYVMVFKPGA